MISLLMSTYNGEKYIIEQLNSILSQTVKLDEVVIIDDCSNDKTATIIEDFIKNNNLSDCWRLIKNVTNRGWKYNFTYGVRETKGDIVFFCDQDDIWFPDKVKAQKNILDSNNDIMVVASQQILYYGEVYNFTELLGASFRRIHLKRNCKNLRNVNVPGCSMAVRRKFYDDVIKYYCEGWAHDEFFWQMALLSDTLALMQEKTVLRRIHKNNTSRRKQDYSKRIQSCENTLSAVNQLLRFIQNNKTIKESTTKKIAISRYRKAVSQRIDLMENRKLYYMIALFIDRSNVYIYGGKKQFFKDLMYAVGLLKKQ